jgi:hypothetical protein
MSDEHNREQDRLRDLLGRYHEPPPFPRESLERELFEPGAARPAATLRPRRVPATAAAAAGIALFLLGAVAGRLLEQRLGPAADTAAVEAAAGVAERDPDGQDVHRVVWF